LYTHTYTGIEQLRHRRKRERERGLWSFIRKFP